MKKRITYLPRLDNLSDRELSLINGGNILGTLGPSGPDPTMSSIGSGVRDAWDWCVGFFTALF